MSTITLTARTFADLVDPVVDYASTDFTLPLLTGVRITTRDGYFMAAATDRYRAAFQRVKASEENPVEDGFRAVVGRRTISRIRQVFKPTRYFDPVLTLTVDGDTLTVEAGATLADQMGDLVGGRLAFELVTDGDKFPKIEGLVPFADQPAEPGRVVANAAYLAGFVKAGSRLSSEPAIIHPASPGKPFIVTRGEDFIAMVQPVRFGGAGGAADVLTSWKSLLSPAPEPVAEKPRRTRKAATKGEAA